MKYVYLRITGSGLIEDEITCNLGLCPEIFYKNGDTCVTRHGDIVEYKEDCWQNRKDIKNMEVIESEVFKYVKNLFDKKEFMDYYKRKGSIQLGAMLYADDYQSTFSISPRLAKLLYELEVDFLVTIAHI